MLPKLEPSNDIEPTDYEELGDKIKNAAPDYEKKDSKVKKKVQGLGILKHIAINSAAHAFMGAFGEEHQDLAYEGKRKNENESPSGTRSRETAELKVPLRGILESLNGIASTVSSIYLLMKAGSTNKIQAKDPANDNATNDNYPASMAMARVANGNGIVGYASRVAGFFNPVTAQNQSLITTANKEPLRTSSYVENDKDNAGPQAVRIEKFDNDALVQIADLLKKATANLSGNGGGFRMPSIIPVPMPNLGIKNAARSFGDRIRNFFGKKNPAEAPKPAEKLPADKVERAKAQARDAKGRFIKPAEAENVLKDTGEALGKTAAKSGGLVRGASKLLGPAAALIDAGFEIKDRMDKHQTATQIAAGTVGHVGGGLAGAAVGAEVGAGVGSVVPVVGTGIGAAVGGIGGYIVGSGLGGRIADHFTGANKIAKKPNLPVPQSRDIVALEKTKNQKEKEQQRQPVSHGPSVVSAPTHNTTVVHQQSTAIAPGSSGDMRGDRGSLDLRKY